MTDPLISVVIPCYNGSSFLADGVRSVLEQRIPCEVIVVDDGSTDDSFARARSLMQEYPDHLILAAQPNQGPAAARNLGLRLARGRFVSFLDVDDQYVPGFFAEALRLLEGDPAMVAVYCQIEFVDAHRTVEPWQRQAIEGSLPGNLIVRTEAAKQIGGFPVHPAFRGPAAGEDIAFRKQLPAFGQVVKIEKPLYRHRCRRGSHFDFFLDRVTLRDGRLHFQHLAPEEQDGSLQKAREEYQAAVAERTRARLAETLRTCLSAGSVFHALLGRLDHLDGFLHPLEGFALYWLARNWPGQGRVVEVGSFKGRSTAWLAMACQGGRKGKVAAVDHFRGSPEHQPTGTHADPDIAGTGSTLPAFRRNIADLGLGDWVDVHVGDSVSVSRNWREPVRLLFLDGDHSEEATAQDFASWSPQVARHGLVLFHDVQVWPGVTRFYQALANDRERWKEVGRIRSLGVLEKLI